MQVKRSFRRIAAAFALTATAVAGVTAGEVVADSTLVINEVDADQVSTDSAEFVELFDGGVGDTDLTGLVLVLFNGSDDASYLAFDLDGHATDADGYFVLCGDASNVSNCDLDVSPNTNLIQNGADAVALLTGDAADFPIDTPVTTTGLIDALVYDTSDSDDAGLLPLLNAGQPQVNERDGGDGTGHSNQRCPDGSGGARNTDTFAQWAPTPGESNVCEIVVPPSAGCDAPAGDLTRISEIQGNGFSSPLIGQEVTLRAVVTLADDDLGGYFVQEEDADTDADPLTSEGLFVDAAGSLPTEEQTVALTGTVLEFFGRTQMTNPATTICGVDPVTIAPTPMMFPIDDAGREALEGMLVTNGQDLQVTGLFTAYGFGELGLAYNGPLDQPTSVYAPDDPQAIALDDLNAASELLVNDRDEAFSSFNPYPWELFDDDLSAGDTMPAGDLIGALSYSFGDYKVEPIDTAFFPQTVDTNVRPDAPSLDDGNDVATFNVLNYFNTFGSRGADNEEEFVLQTAKIVDAISRLDAAVVGLMEIENDYEDIYDDDDATVASIVTLVDALNAVDGKNTWDYIRPNENILTTIGDGGLGPDAIAVGMVYQRNRARAVGVANTFDIDALLEGDIDNSRWPLAQTFKIDGEDVTVVVNHFKSKGSPCTDTAGPDFDFGDDVEGEFTGNCDLTRQYAAHRLLEWVEDGATNKKTDNVLLVGDFNSYEEEAPIEILVDAGYVDLVQRDGGDAFTYKFSGRYGRLDYVFASPSLADSVTAAEVWQINSPAPYGYLYSNDPIDDTAHASSDHDPVVISLS